MDRAVLELVRFYQSEIRQHEDAALLLKRLHVHSPETIDHFSLGYCSGKALEVASDSDRLLYRQLGLVCRAREIFDGCIVFPVMNENELVDLFGIRFSGAERRYFYWQEPPKGLIGIEAVRVYPEIILTDNAYYALHVRQLGYPNVVGLRKPEELKLHLKLLQSYPIERVYLLSRKHRNLLESQLKKIGIETIVLPNNTSNGLLDKQNFTAVGKHEAKKASLVKVASRSEGRVHFAVDDILYKVDTLSLSGLGLKTQIRAEREGVTYLDRVDLALANARSRFAKGCGMRLMVSSLNVENHLNEIASQLDRMTLEEAQAHIRAPKALSQSEEAEALKVLKSENVLELQAKALVTYFGIIGEDANRKLGVLVAASRLLDKPLGCIIRGAPSSGKSTLIQAVAKLLPYSKVLFLSRLTPQALYFLPKETLLHAVMVVDEYEGVSECEYSLRTMMSSQTLSLAITIREGGRVPVTKVMEIPARLAVLVSATHPVNVENLSRFIELRMDTSREQTQRVMKMLGKANRNGSDGNEIERLRNLNQLLLPCKVTVPYGEKLVYETESVLSRRRFAQVIGLVQAHAALFQQQRKMERLEPNLLHVTAEPDDYRQVYPLMEHVVHQTEESLSPAAMELLERVAQRTFTIRDLMKKLSWSYSKVYRVLCELGKLNLVIADRRTSGVERVHELAPYSGVEKGELPHPDSI